MLKRRDFVLGLGTALAQRAANAQPAGKPVIGYLGATTAQSDKERIRVLLQQLEVLGWSERRNFEMSYRWAEGRPDAFEQIAAEFVRLKVTMIVATGVALVQAAQRVTSEIPIVFGPTGDPVLNGIVSNLSRPGGNVTGVSIDPGTGIVSKRFELVRQMVPALKSIAVFGDPNSSAAMLEMREIEATARKFEVGCESVRIPKVEAFSAAFDAAKTRAGMVHLCTSPMFSASRAHIANCALNAGLPTIYIYREYTQAGGLMSYGPNVLDAFRRLAGYVDKVLRGARPGELPVEQPSRFKLAINLRTAKALNLSVPPILLATADEIIE